MTTRFPLAVVVAAMCGILPVSATIVGTGLIDQLTYLGNSSQPDRVPLSPVIYNANHGYDSHTAIFQSRPCYHGYFETDSRPEYEQNLAVLFGISCSLSDSTQMPGCVATFSIRKAQVPSNAPYTQERVLAASLQTLLLHSWGMSKGAPLTVNIKGDGIPKPKWAAKYEGPYFYPEEELKSDAERKPLKVQGIRIDREAVPGVTYLVFDGVAPDPKIKPRMPVFVPYLPEGECDCDTVEIVPMWPGDSWEEPLGVLTRPELPYYEKWSGGGGQFKEYDATPWKFPLLETAALLVLDDNAAKVVRIVGGEMTPRQISAFVFACVATTRPTPERPLRIEFEGLELPDDYASLLKSDSAWKDGTSCEFGLEPKTMKLLKGSVPEYRLAGGGNGLYVAMIENNAKADGDKALDLPSFAVDLAKICRELEPVGRDEFLHNSRLYRKKLSDWVENGEGDRNDILRIILVLWYYEFNPQYYENLWWRESDRYTRSLLGCLAGTLVASGQLEKLLAKSAPSERAMRMEELSQKVVSRLKEDANHWAVRCEELNSKTDENQEASPPSSGR